MNIVIATSGNGGHLFCGLSVAEKIREKIKDRNVFFLGSGNRQTQKLVEDKGFKFYKIYASGLLGKGIWAYIKFIISQIINLIQSGLLFLYIKPQIIFSTGGFAAIGIVFWSFIFRKSCIIHEQNFIPGKANLLSAYFAKKILISFEGTRNYFKDKECIYTGMPIRFKKRLPKDCARQSLGLDKEKFTVLVMGGSKGAHRINQFIIEILEKLPKDIQFIHLAGNEDLNFIKEAYIKNGFVAHAEDFSMRMEVIYSASSLVIGRAGSGMLAEIMFFGLPSVLVPYPHSRDKHQYKNAEYLAQKGAAVVIPEENMSFNRIIELVSPIGRNKLEVMAKHSTDLANPNAVDKIVDEIMDLLK